MAPRRPRTARALFAPSAIIGARVRGARRVSGRAMVPGELPAPKGRAGAASFVREAAKGAHFGLLEVSLAPTVSSHAIFFGVTTGILAVTITRIASVNENKRPTHLPVCREGREEQPARPVYVEAIVDKHIVRDSPLLFPFSPITAP